jgi:hypothetical protein
MCYFCYVQFEAKLAVDFGSVDGAFGLNDCFLD